MEDYKREFIEFMVQSNVLTLAILILKSGRKSPFFMNGALCHWRAAPQAGTYYARAIHDNFWPGF